MVVSVTIGKAIADLTSVNNHPTEESREETVQPFSQLEIKNHKSKNDTGKQIETNKHLQNKHFGKYNYTMNVSINYLEHMKEKMLLPVC